MEARRGARVLGGVLVVGLMAVAATIALLGGDAGRGGEVADDAKGSARDMARPPSGGPISAASPELAEELGAIATQGRGEDLHEATADPSVATSIDRAARDFLRHYLAYEIGRLSRGVRAGLRDTTTPSFGAELLRAAPRFPPGLEARPASARIVELDIVDQVDVKTESAGIVARLTRGGKPEAAAFTLELRDGRWRVSGVTG